VNRHEVHNVKCSGTRNFDSSSKVKLWYRANNTTKWTFLDTNEKLLAERRMGRLPKLTFNRNNPHPLSQLSCSLSCVSILRILSIRHTHNRLHTGLLPPVQMCSEKASILKPKNSQTDQFGWQAVLWYSICYSDRQNLNTRSGLFKGHMQALTPHRTKFIAKALAWERVIKRLGLQESLI
jgi:hypothetical protein